MVILDTTTLLLLIEPTSKPPKDPDTGKPLDRCKDRLEYLTKTLSEAGSRVVVPTPVLAELLVGAGAARSAYLSELQASSVFQIISFDVKSAVELSFLLEANNKPVKSKLSRVETWAKVKFDRQIIAIAKAHNISDIYTDDGHLTAVAEANGVVVHHTWDLKLPPQDKQVEMELTVPKEPPEEEDDNEREG